MKRILLLTLIFVGMTLNLWGAAAVPKQQTKAKVQRQRQILIQEEQMSRGRQEAEYLSESSQQQTPGEEVEEIVDLSQLLEALAQTGQPWSLIMDPEPKLMIVQHFIERFRQHSIVIRKPAVFYAQQLDSMSQTHPDMLRQPLPDILQTIAIIEYDFDNGQNKDAMALKVLGQSAFEQNRRRLGLR